MKDAAEARRRAQYSGALAKEAWLLATCPDEHLRDGKKALSEARQACELDHWRDSDDIDTLAAARAEVGDFDQAVTKEKKPWSFR